MLPNILPGLREIRAPLAAGYLWLFAAWLRFGQRFDALTSSTSSGSEVALLARDAISSLGTVGRGIALSFVAYLVGSLAIFIGTRLLTAPVVWWKTRPRRDGQGPDVTNAVERYASGDTGDGEVVDLSKVDAAEAQAVLYKAQQSDPLTLPRIRALMAEETPKAADDADRFRAEAEMRMSVALPLCALILVLLSRHSIGWPVALAALAPVALLARDGFRYQAMYFGILWAVLRSPRRRRNVSAGAGAPEGLRIPGSGV